jgi:hypothetical protein
MKPASNKNTPNGDLQKKGYMASFDDIQLCNMRNVFLTISALAIFSLLFQISLDAQELRFPINKKGKVYLEDGTVLHFAKLTNFTDSVLCVTGNHLSIIIQKESIYKLEVKGNHALEMTLLFSGLGALTGWAYASSWKGTILEDKRSSAYTICIPIFSVGGLISGLLWPKYKTVYVKKDFKNQIE